MTVEYIEVYEWPEGEPRRTSSSNMLDTVEVPSGGQVPQVGDELFIEQHGRVTVVERTLLWAGRRDADNAVKWGKMWIHVRKKSSEAGSRDD